MNISDELRAKVERLLANNETLRNQILNGDYEAIRKIGSISQHGIKPEDVIKAHNNNEMGKLYERARNLIELREVYSELCEACMRAKMNPDDENR